MARRAVSHDSNDSLKENNGLPSSAINSGSSKASSKGKRAAMRDHHAADDVEDQDAAMEEEDQDAQGEEDEEGEDGEGDEDAEDDAEQSPKGRKRARANTQGDARPTAGPSKPEKRGQTLPRDEDGFVPGSIVRIQLRNFLTYDWVEFRPGPYLNMIFGPNGTGKSSIACAICLGLNFPPAVLGRAQDLKSFVKNDKEEGHIEIELKGAKGKSNLVIRRNLSANSKTAPFMLNGRSASGKDINQRMAELNVQVSNLCTFLPQDRVAEFARMTPQQLLRETQRCAGNENLTSWHDTLIQSGKDLKTLQDLVNADKEQLKTMEDRNANLERDVRRYEERRALERRIELLELVVPFKHYYEAREQYRLLKPQQREAVKNVKRLQRKHRPFVAKSKELEAELKHCEKAREEKKNLARRKVQGMSQKWNENNDLEEKAEEIKQKLDNLKRTEKTRQQDIKKLQKSIEDGGKLLANPPKTEDLDEIQRLMRELNAETSVVRDKQQDLQDKQRANAAESSKWKREIDRVNADLQRLDNHAHQKLEHLRRFDADAADVVDWLRQNRSRFRMEIFEPAVLCVTVPNRQFVDAVEACFGGTQLRTFVAQCEDDYQLLNRLCVDTPEALGKKARINTWFKARDEGKLQPPPLPVDQLRAEGFDGYALEFVDCPEGLKWFLCADVRLHRTALAVRTPEKVSTTRAMEMAARANGCNYVIGRVMNAVTRSKYGKRLPQNRTTDVQQARSLVHAAIDPQIKRGLQGQLSEAQTNFGLAQDEENELSKKDKEIQDEGKKFKERHDSLEGRKRAVLDARKKVSALQLRMDRDQEKLNRLLHAKPVDVERDRFRQELLKLASQRVSLLQQYVRLMHESIKEQEKAAKAGLEYLQVQANKDALEAECKGQSDEIAVAQAHFVEIHQRFAEVKEDSREKLRISREKLEECDDEIRGQFQQMEEAGDITRKSTAEWEAELATGHEELNMNMATNANVVEQYNKRKAEIETLSATIEEREKRVLKIERDIKAARDNWHPELVKLVDSIGKKFSGAFDRIGCAGEIRIREEEDYEKWAIDIMVKFRDHEKLQLLTGERQSGGERSLTTILYLMSLTEEARAPFSLVDEINQGMDQRAERAVHNSLVEVTCKPDSGQYFLITPKLLPDLHYHERMKILCVNNGEWLPEEESSTMGNMNGLIESFLRFRRERGSSAA